MMNIMYFARRFAEISFEGISGFFVVLAILDLPDTLEGEFKTCIVWIRLARPNGIFNVSGR
jgi:hypothetical protein